MTPASAKTRILFLNRSYYPDAEATGQLLTQLCEDLALQFDVRVISGQPNSNPSGARFLPQGEEQRRGVAIRRVWHSRFAKDSAVGRLVNWSTYIVTAAAAAVRSPRPEIVVVETDPPLLCLVGALLRRRFRCRLVVYLQDIYPDLGVALGKLPDSRLIRRLRAAFFRVYRGADRIIVLSDDMRQVLIEGGIDQGKIEKISNWVDCSRVVPIKQANAFRRELGLHDKFVVMHSGNVGFCQGLENVLEAAAILRAHREIVFLLVGDGAAKQRLRDVASHRGLANVRFVDYQPASRLSESLSAADVHLVTVDPRVAAFLMPSKLYGALASGTPILAVAPPACELARLVEQEQVGWVAPPLNPAALADRIVELSRAPYDFQQMGDRARRLALRRFDRVTSVAAFADLLRELSGDGSMRRGQDDPCPARKSNVIVVPFSDPKKAALG